MLRAIALSLSLILSLGVVIPLLTSNVEAGPRHHHKKKRKKFKKYSQAWWRNYHHRQQQMRVLAARKRALQLRREMLASQSAANGGEQTALNTAAKGNQQNVFGSDSAPMQPSGKSAARGNRQRAQDNKNEMQFRLQDDAGAQIGSAQLSVIGSATGADSDNFRSKTIGGVSTAALRRTVIDRMMKEEGWVVNDYQKDVSGKKVYVVVAQSKGANGQTQSRLFYFTEAEGKIYSLVTNSPNDASERLAQESEKVINSLQQRTNRPVQAGLR